MAAPARARQEVEGFIHSGGPPSIIVEGRVARPLLECRLPESVGCGAAMGAVGGAAATAAAGVGNWVVDGSCSGAGRRWRVLSVR
eukprot:scaffold172254_cov31-Tisochrysis_lutea.AAC.4